MYQEDVWQWNILSVWYGMMGYILFAPAWLTPNGYVQCDDNMLVRIFVKSIALSVRGTCLCISYRIGAPCLTYEMLIVKRKDVGQCLCVSISYAMSIISLA